MAVTASENNKSRWLTNARLFQPVQLVQLVDLVHRRPGPKPALRSSSYVCMPRTMPGASTTRRRRIWLNVVRIGGSAICSTQMQRLYLAT